MPKLDDKDEPEVPNLHIVQEAIKSALKQREYAEEWVRHFLEQNKPALERVTEAVKRMTEVHALMQPKEELHDLVFAEFQTPQQSRLYLSDEDKEEIVEALAEKLIRAKGTKQSAFFTNPTVVLPPGARWEDVAISFLNTYEVIVRYKDAEIGTFDYANLEFSKRGPREDRIPGGVLWELLYMLAILSGGYEDLGDTRPTKQTLLQSFTDVKENALEKRRSNLATKLQSAFGITDEPFLPYDPTKGYRPKFALKPPPDLRGDGEVHRSGISFKDDLYSDD